MSGHVLVARLDNDGDVLLAGPAVRAVAAGAERVTLLCGPRGRAAAALLPGVDELLVHRAEWIDPEPEPFSPAPTRRLLSELRRRRPFDAAVVLTSFHQSPLPLALLLRLAGIPRIGATSDDYPGSLLDVRHRIDDDVHEVERSLSLVAAMGYSLPAGDDGALRVRLRDGVGGPARESAHAEFAHAESAHAESAHAESAHAESAHAESARAERLAPGEPPPGAASPYLVVHPGASVTARAWAPWRCAELVAALTARGWTVAVTGAPGERALTRRVAAAGDPDRTNDLGGATDLAGLARTIAGARAIVVGNTGPAHLAAAVGTPVVSLYAPTVPAVRWRPWRVPHALLHEPVPCAGCRARTCPVPDHPCVDGVPLETVLDAVQRLAGTPDAPAREEAVAA